MLFLAFFLEGRTKTLDDWRNTLLPAILPTLMFLVLIVMQPDLGTAIACAAITGCVLFVAGLDMRYFAYGALASVLPLYFLIFHVAYRRDRILAFLDPYADPQGKGFHIIQSLIAVSTGGLTGTGLMEGKQKLFYLPEPHTDFIFSVVAEELGLVGAVILVVLFAVFLWRGMRTALRTQDLLRTLPRCGHHQHGGGAGLHQYQRRAGTDADQGHSPAAHLVWGVLAHGDARLRGCPAQRQQARGVTCVARAPTPACEARAAAKVLTVKSHPA